jgi:hypothetical protein
VHIKFGQGRELLVSDAFQAIEWDASKFSERDRVGHISTYDGSGSADAIRCFESRGVSGVVTPTRF